MVSVHPARWCTSPLGVVPAGLGDDVGDYHDVANLPGKCLFISLLYLFLGNMLYSFFKSIILGIFVLLDMLVAKWVPTPCYRDAYSVGTPSPLAKVCSRVGERNFSTIGHLLDIDSTVGKRVRLTAP